MVVPFLHDNPNGIQVWKRLSLCYVYFVFCSLSAKCRFFFVGVTKKAPWNFSKQNHMSLLTYSKLRPGLLSGGFWDYGAPAEAGTAWAEDEVSFGLFGGLEKGEYVCRETCQIWLEDADGNRPSRDPEWKSNTVYRTGGDARHFYHDKKTTRHRS